MNSAKRLDLIAQWEGHSKGLEALFENDPGRYREGIGQVLPLVEEYGELPEVALLAMGQVMDMFQAISEHTQDSEKVLTSMITFVSFLGVGALEKIPR